MPFFRSKSKPPKAPAEQAPKVDRAGAEPSKAHAGSPASGAALSERLKRLSQQDDAPNRRFGARLRTYFLTGLIIVGPVTITLYIVWSLVSLADIWIKPLIPTSYLPETYLPFAIPGIGLLIGIVGLIVIGAFAANLLGRSLITTGELMFERMPIVRNVYRALKQVFEGVVTSAGQSSSFQKVGLMEFPSQGIWSLVFVTNEAARHFNNIAPDGQQDLIAVFMPTGVVPPTGFICFVPRKRVLLLDLSAEDAAKIIISGGMVLPDAPEVAAATTSAENSPPAVSPKTDNAGGIKAAETAKA